MRAEQALTAAERSTPSLGPGSVVAGQGQRMLLLLAIGFVVAVGLRIPYFADIPGYTDETEEVLLGLQIAHGQALPLTNMANYVGPLWNYVLAAIFLVVGPNPDAARATMVLIGAASVPLAGWLGLRAGGPVAALVAAGLMATSAVGILLGSHIAWSVCVTPLIFGIGALLLLRAAERGGGRDLPLAGLAFGLALQTHPVAAAALPGAIAAALLMPGGRRLLRQPRLLALTALLFVLPLVSLAVDALTGGLLRQLEGPLHRTTFVPSLDPREIAPRLLGLLVQMLRAVGSTLEGSGDPLRYLLQPRFVLFALWLVAGLVLAVRRRAWMLVLPALSYALLWPIVDPNYDLFYESRYVLSLLPFLYVAMGLAADAVWQATERLDNARASAARASLALLLVAASAWPLLDLAVYVQRQVDTGRTNAVAREALAAADQSAGPDTLLLIDEELQKPGFAGGTYFHWLRYRRAMSGRPLLTLSLNEDAAVRELRASGPTRLLLLSRSRPARELGGVYTLQRVGHFGASDDSSFDLYLGDKQR